MIKREELTHPSSCMSRANDDEMTFVLLERDITFPATIRHWVNERIRYGKNERDDPQIIEALACADRVEKFHQDRIDRLLQNVIDNGYMIWKMSAIQIAIDIGTYAPELEGISAEGILPWIKNWQERKLAAARDLLNKNL
jgi:hypothetical protein